MKFAGWVLLLLALVGARPVAADQVGAFDFYVLSLSWSPSYCEAEGPDGSPQQCAGKRPYAFVVHGLWPQYERGFPDFCRASEPGPDRDAISGMLDIMPDPGLVRHQWRKHGTCTGLKGEDYFALLRQARSRVTIPAVFQRPDTYLTVTPQGVERDFSTANPGLTSNAIAVTCDGRRLREVRVCFTKDLDFRACPEVDRRACRAAKVVMPPVR